MYFTITFKAAKENKMDDEANAIRYLPCDFGLNMLDEVRGDYKLTEEQLPSNNVHDCSCCDTKRCVNIYISEGEARKCGNIFLDRPSVEVVVPNEFLNPYQAYKYELKAENLSRTLLEVIKNLCSRVWNKTKPNKEYSVKISNKVLTEDVVIAWQAAGCPLRWGFESKGTSNYCDEETPIKD